MCWLRVQTLLHSLFKMKNHKQEINENSMLHTLIQLIELHQIIIQ